MKKIFILTISVILLTGCTNKSKSVSVEHKTEIESPVVGQDEKTPVASEQNPDEVICNAIADFLKGNETAVHFTEAAKKDLYESSWPEVQCSVEGLLDSPSSFKDLVVKKVGEGMYKYECVCPDHGDRYIDCCTISASVGPEGMVMIEHVVWDDKIE